MSAEIFIVVGAIVLVSAWLPLFLHKTPLSLPIIAVALGWVLPLFAEVRDPLVTYSGYLEHVTEVVLLSAVYGAGLKVDRPFNLHTWSSTWRLLFLVMPISMLMLVPLAMVLGQLSFGLAFLVAAMLAPTDPVLASELQLGPPGRGEEGESRFALTTEAGINDGLAFPFVLLGVGLLDGSIADWSTLAQWAGLELVASTIGGALFGAAIGFGLIKLNSRLPTGLRLHVSNSGLAGLALAFVTYGICEMVGINGFVAVFFEAVAARNTKQSPDYAVRLAHASEQIEQAVMVFVMLFFGFALSHGLLAGIRIELVLFAILALLVVRPLATMVSFLGSSHAMTTRLALSYFGIRGVGSLFYAAYIVAHHPLDWSHDVLTMTAVTVLGSIVLYGVTSPFVIRKLVAPEMVDRGGTT